MVSPLALEPSAGGSFSVMSISLLVSLDTCPEIIWVFIVLATGQAHEP
jgi:hypothetical protein